MIRQPGPTRGAQRLFPALAVAALVASLAQVVLGGVVRVTDSGLGCPDWPLCHGRIVPPFELTVLIEYSHRLSASLLTLLALAVAAMSWIYYRRAPLIWVPAVLGLALVLVAAVLGGVTVLTELAWWVVLLHLALAESAVACLTAVVVVSLRDRTRDAARDERTGARVPYRLVVATAAATFLLILSGSHMVGYGAGMSCGTWPLCRGGVLPEHAVQIVHVAHRYAAAAVGVLLVGAAVAVWARAGRDTPLRWTAVGLVVAFGAQVAAGAEMVLSEFPDTIRGLHLGLATVVWIIVVAMALLALPARRLRPGQPFGYSGRVPRPTKATT